jgi:hypothetical protein
MLRIGIARACGVRVWGDFRIGHVRNRSIAGVQRFFCPRRMTLLAQRISRGSISEHAKQRRVMAARVFPSLCERRQTATPRHTPIARVTETSAAAAESEPMKRAARSEAIQRAVFDTRMWLEDKKKNFFSGGCQVVL